MSLPLPTALSPSKVSSFKDCALAFRFSAIDRLPEPPSPWTVKGNLVHRALEQLFWQVPAGQRSLDAGLGQLERAWESARGEPELGALELTPVEMDELRADTERLVRGYFELEDPDRVTAVGVELALEADLGDLRLRGVIDRLDVDPDGRLVVTAYKSGRGPADGPGLSCSGPGGSPWPDRRSRRARRRRLRPAPGQPGRRPGALRGLGPRRPQPDLVHRGRRPRPGLSASSSLGGADGGRPRGRVGAGERRGEVVLPAATAPVVASPAAAPAPARHEQLPERPRHVGVLRRRAPVGGRSPPAAVLRARRGGGLEPGPRPYPSRIRRAGRGGDRRPVRTHRPAAGAPELPIRRLGGKLQESSPSPPR